MRRPDAAVISAVASTRVPGTYQCAKISIEELEGMRPRVDGDGRDSAPTADEICDVMTAIETAAFLRVGKNVVYDLVGRNEIPHRRLGKQIRFSRSALVRWLSSCGRSQDAQKGH